MFLEMFVGLPIDNDISLDIKNTIATFDQYNKYELKCIINDIK